MQRKKVVVVGGGTGSFTLLRSLKKHDIDLTAIVNMADDGGSTGVLRDELGVLPPGDVRQCLVALANYERARELFNYRFEEGTFKGHAFGNLFITALEKMTGSFAEAIEEASRVLNVAGKVEPITLDKVTLMMRGDDGTETAGEFNIADKDFRENKRPELWLTPRPRLNPIAAEAMLHADLIVVAPGNVYGSLAPALIVPGVSEVLRKSAGKFVYVVNLVTKPGQTDGFTVEDFAAEIERFSNVQLDYVLYNKAKPDDILLQRYAKEGEYWVRPGDAIDQRTYHALGDDFIAREFVAQNSSVSDPIAASRSFIRHDSNKIARRIVELLDGR